MDVNFKDKVLNEIITDYIWDYGGLNLKFTPKSVVFDLDKIKVKCRWESVGSGRLITSIVGMYKEVDTESMGWYNEKLSDLSFDLTSEIYTYYGI